MHVLTVPTRYVLFHVRRICECRLKMRYQTW